MQHINFILRTILCACTCMCLCTYVHTYVLRMYVHAYVLLCTDDVCLQWIQCLVHFLGRFVNWPSKTLTHTYVDCYLLFGMRVTTSVCGKNMECTLIHVHNCFMSVCACCTYVCIYTLLEFTETLAW